MPGNRWDSPNLAPPDPTQRQGFQDVNKEVVATRGVKIQSKAAKKREEENREREAYKKKFELNAEKTIANHINKGDRAMDVISRFMNMSKDKVLSRNKSAISEDVEREARQDLIQLALDLNNDEQEEDNGKGSVVVLSLLSKIVLMNRDRMNELEYELELANKEIKILKNKSSQPNGKP